VSLDTRTTELVDIFPPVPAVPSAASRPGMLPVVDETITRVFAALHRELLGKRYRRT
jgi:hypothetical protein